MNKLKLSKRLQRIVSLVDCGDLVVDIGCDHGKVLAELFLENKIKRAIATDISAPSVEKTKKLLTELGYIDFCKILVGDGFENVSSNEIDCCIIAGMGGHEIIKIMNECTLQVSSWVLQPMSDEELMRTYLNKSGYCILEDEFLLEKGKYYTILKVGRGKQKLNKLQQKFGKDYFKNDDFLTYAQKEMARIKEYINFANKKSKRDLIKRYKELQKAARR